MSRAGEACSVVPAENSPISDGYFEVPDNMTAIDCTSLDYRFEVAEADCCVAPITVEMVTMNSSNAVRRLVADVESYEVLDTVLSSISGEPAWRYEIELRYQDRPPVRQRWLVLSLRWYSLVVVASDERADIDSATTWESFDELVDSLWVEREPQQHSLAIVSGGRCTTERWTVDVPDGWFHMCATDNEIVHFNSSPVSDIAMQCECLGPLWIGDRPFDGYGVSDEDLEREIFDEQSAVRFDGTPISIKDYLWGDSYVGQRMLRSVTVHFEDHDVVITANQTADHVGPFGTWEDTLAAQAAMVDSVRSHSSPP